MRRRHFERGKKNGWLEGEAVDEEGLENHLSLYVRRRQRAYYFVRAPSSSSPHNPFPYLQSMLLLLPWMVGGGQVASSPNGT